MRINPLFRKITGYALSGFVALLFFTLASYSNTFDYKLFEMATKFFSLFIYGLLLKHFFSKGQTVIGVIVIGLLLLYVLLPFNAYRLSLTLPAYSFCLFGLAFGLYYRKRNILINITCFLILIGLALINTNYIYPNYVSGRINKADNNLIISGIARNLLTTIPLMKGDSTIQVSIENDKIYLVEFFFENCPPCKIKKPFLDKLEKSINDPEFEVIYIQSGIDAFATYKKNYLGSAGIVLYDKNDLLIDRLGIKSFPFEIIIDKKGRTRFITEGFDNGQYGNTYVTSTQDKIQKLLNE